MTKNGKKLNLGCGNEYRIGWINLDSDKKIKAEVYHDLNKFPYPFKDNEFDEVLASHILEHLDNPVRVMLELYRIIKDKGILYITSPHFSDPQKWSEFSHKHCFSCISFGCWHCNKELFPYFEVLKKKISFTRINFSFLNKIFNPLINLNPLIYERMFSGIFPSAVITYILRVRKDKKYHEDKLVFQRKMELRKGIDNLKFIKEI